MAPLLVWTIAVAASGVVPDLGAAPPKDAATLRAERGAVRLRAERARQALAASEVQRQEAVEALAEADRSLSEARRQLAETERARDAARAAHAEAKAAADAAGLSLRADQARLARLVANRHATAAPEPLKLWLSGRDPSEVARMSAWLAAVGRARLDAIDGWRRDRERHAALAAIAEAARRAQEDAVRDVIRDAGAVEGRRREHAAALARASADIRRQRASLDQLARDESRIRALLERLARPVPRPDARREAGKSRARGADAPPATGFGAMRGLPMPVRGELAGRFGSPREGSGAPWRGWFIASAQGADVRAVAAGQVVWADWLRGFGNLLILDHGDGYMTLYGHNEALFAAVGASVDAGATIGQAGVSGGAEAPGVYFEIRHDGRAVDPAPWFARATRRAQ
ncbi:Murein hydrolase activator EnvC [Burkholderiales bacterium]|nr:Murein hydrolase activator EnvC [Burkholderiales bacterium]